MSFWGFANEQSLKTKRYETLCFDIFFSCVRLGTESVALTGSIPELKTLNLTVSADTDKPKVSPMAGEAFLKKEAVSG